MLMTRLFQIALLAVMVWFAIGQYKADHGTATGKWAMFAYVVDDDDLR